LIASAAQASADLQVSETRRVWQFTRAAFPAAARHVSSSEKHGHHHTKTDVVIPVVGLIPVAVSDARVALIVVERAAAQHAVVFRVCPHNKQPGAMRYTGLHGVKHQTLSEIVGAKHSLSKPMFAKCLGECFVPTAR
jgi:hypothetical protein